MELDHSGSINCVTQFLTNIETVVGTISVSNILNLARNVTASNFPLNITCTDCNKAIYNEVNQSIPSLATDLGPALKTQCGASFIGKALFNASIKIQRTDFLGT